MSKDNSSNDIITKQMDYESFVGLNLPFTGKSCNILDFKYTMTYEK